MGIVTARAAVGRSVLHRDIFHEPTDLCHASLDYSVSVMKGRMSTGIPGLIVLESTTRLMY